MIRCQFLSSRLCSTASVRQMITTVCAKNSSEATIHGNDNKFSDSTERDDGNHVHEIGLTPHHVYIDTSKFQRIILSIGSSIAALVNPHRLTHPFSLLFNSIIDVGISVEYGFSFDSD